MADVRKCNKCDIEKPLTGEYFAKKSGHYERACRQCVVRPVMERPEGIPDTRKCPGCYAEKALTSEYFGKKTKGPYGFSSTCYDCNRKASAEYKAKNKEKISKYNTKWKIEHKADITKYNAEYIAERKATDPAFKIRLQNRIRVIGALKGHNKSDHTEVLLGCDPDMFTMWLEYRFVDGMTMDNYGEVWHLDHVRPCASFDMSKPEEQKKAFHWTNYQPLFAKDNMDKRAKVDEDMIAMQAVKVQEFIQARAEDLKEFKYTLL